ILKQVKSFNTSTYNKSGHGFLLYVVKGGGALRSLRALKPSTHLVIAIFLCPLRGAEAACALEVDAMRALDLVEAVRALDLVEVEVVGLSLNILISTSLSGYLTSLYKTSIFITK
ncbi:hypothetical protein Tco_0170507, partial [Tanacetum coccineum]